MALLIDADTFEDLDAAEKPDRAHELNKNSDAGNPPGEGGDGQQQEAPADEGEGGNSEGNNGDGQAMSIGTMWKAFWHYLAQGDISLAELHLAISRLPEKNGDDEGGNTGDSPDEGDVDAFISQYALSLTDPAAGDAAPKKSILQQLLALANTPIFPAAGDTDTGGFFRLAFDDARTDALLVSITLADLQAALEELDGTERAYVDAVDGGFDIRIITAEEGRLTPMNIDGIGDFEPVDLPPADDRANQSHYRLYFDADAGGTFHFQFDDDTTADKDEGKRPFSINITAAELARC